MNRSGDRSSAEPSTQASEGTEPPAETALLDRYEGEIIVRLERLPGLQPRVLPTRSKSVWRRFVQAGQRRSFTLVRDFEIELSGEALPPNLRGTLVVPRVADGVSNVFDGATIPLPWVVTYLSFGVLRPLGILLAASVIHDFAFQFGYLAVRRNGKLRQVPVARHDADELFRLIAATVNRSRLFSRLAWHAVRLGWWGIPYAGQRFSGRAPVQSTVFAVVAIVLALLSARLLSNTWLFEVEGLRLPAALIGLVVGLMGSVYVWISIERLFRS